ncbi:MAG: carboxymuconolactone decarboxylase family protein [Pyrinomonadaceae bacterium]
MSAFIREPARLPFLLKLAIWIAERFTGKVMLPARILAWYPKAAIGSGFLEGFTAHGRTDAEKRLLRLVRLQAACTVACPFCFDMNSFEYEKHGISESELAGFLAGFEGGFSSTFSHRDKLALEYSRLISATPLSFPDDFVVRLKAEFSEREIVMLAATAAQVNYWARLIQAMGIPPVGFSDKCQLPIDWAKQD